jgi:glycerol-1-phosphatase
MGAVAWVIDLDGVVWLGDTAIAGSAEAIAELRRSGTRVVFLTNNSNRRVEQHVAKLARMGVPVEREDVLTSAQAAARLVEEGSTALVCGGPGIDEALDERRVRVVRRPPADAVIVGWHREFDYQALTLAMHGVLGGATLIGTNDDATYPTTDGPIPGGGSILAAVAYASGVEPVVAGKPNEPTAALLRQRVGDLDMVVGDRPSTDGRMARRVGAPFGLVLSGVTRPRHGPLDPPGDVEAPDLARLVASRDAAE